jgi:hypothetical protein
MSKKKKGNQFTRAINYAQRCEHLWRSGHNAVDYLTSKRDGGELSLLRANRLTLEGKEPVAHWIADWLQNRNARDNEKKNPCHDWELRPGQSKEPMWGQDTGLDIVMCHLTRMAGSRERSNET